MRQTCCQTLRFYDFDDGWSFAQWGRLACSGHCMNEEYLSFSFSFSFSSPLFHTQNDASPGSTGNSSTQTSRHEEAASQSPFFLFICRLSPCLSLSLSSATSHCSPRLLIFFLVFEPRKNRYRPPRRAIYPSRFLWGGEGVGCFSF